MVMAFEVLKWWKPEFMTDGICCLAFHCFNLRYSMLGGTVQSKRIPLYSISSCT